MLFVRGDEREEGMVVLPMVVFGVGRKSGSCIAQASGQCCLETQLAWAHVAVNGLF